MILVYSLQNLLASHDIVAQRDYQPKLGEIPIEVDEDEETIKIVQLVKSHDPTVSKTVIHTVRKNQIFVLFPKISFF